MNNEKKLRLTAFDLINQIEHMANIAHKTYHGSPKGWRDCTMAFCSDAMAMTDAAKDDLSVGEQLYENGVANRCRLRDSKYSCCYHNDCKNMKCCKHGD